MFGGALAVFCGGLLVSPVSVRGDGPQRGEIIGFSFSVSSKDAAKYVARVTKEKEVLAKYLTYAPGFPKILTEADFSVIPSGEQVVALGVCPIAERKSQRAILKAFYPDLIVDELNQEWSNFSCPSLTGGWVVKGTGAVNADHMRLGGAVLSRKGAVASASEGLMLTLYLRRYGEDLADWKELTFPAGCTATISQEALTSDNGAIRLEKTCEAPAGSVREVLRFTAVGGKIVPAPSLDQTPDVRALVWVLAGDDAAAKEAVSRWEREKAALPRDLLALSSGYPKVVKSDEYPGLPAGKRAVLLGVCPADRVEQPMRALAALDSRITAEKVKLSGGEPDCPKVGRQMYVMQVERQRVGTYELTVMWAENQDRERLLAAFLRDASGALVDHRAQEPMFTEVKKLSVVKKKEGGSQEVKGIQASTTWAIVEEGDLTEQDITVTYAVADGKIIVSEKQGPRRTRPY